MNVLPVNTIILFSLTAYSLAMIMEMNIPSFVPHSMVESKRNDVFKKQFFFLFFYIYVFACVSFYNIFLIVKEKIGLWKRMAMLMLVWTTKNGQTGMMKSQELGLRNIMFIYVIFYRKESDGWLESSSLILYCISRIKNVNNFLEFFENREVVSAFLIYFSIGLHGVAVVFIF